MGGKLNSACGSAPRPSHSAIDFISLCTPSSDTEHSGRGWGDGGVWGVVGGWTVPVYVDGNILLQTISANALTKWTETYRLKENQDKFNFS